MTDNLKDETVESPVVRNPDYLYPAVKRPYKNIVPIRLKPARVNRDGSPRIDPSQMRDVMFAPFEEFEKINGAVVTRKNGRRHIYIDRGSSVLGVAHLDSVALPTHFWCNDEYIACPTIDNRLGAWIVLHGLPALGFASDILLTDGEESHNSSARDFEPEKTYNWIYSFDRQGVDAALYGFKDTAWVAELKKFGLEGVHGSYSDIADLERLGCKGVNVGCGMWNYHGDKAHAIVTQLTTQMTRFKNFCIANWNTKFPHVEVKYDRYDEGYDWTNRRNHAAQIGLGNTLEHEMARLKVLWEYFYDHLILPEEWNIIFGEEKYSQVNSFRCPSCGKFFSHKDTVYSSVRSKNLCKACFLLEMLPARLQTPEEYVAMTDAINLAIAKQAQLEKTGDSL